jgi:UDP-N-acetylglucosamine 4,6-dehydratase
MMNVFDDKTVFVSGGTGTFGKNFLRAILKKHNPKRVVIYSRDELKQFEMRSEFDDPRIRFFIGDVRDKERLIQATQGVDFIVHAAAMKQVPASEYNPTECIKTNIYGAENLIAASIKNCVKRVIALSTDKAACPINLYGATKLASDKLFVAANNITGGAETIFSVVRYGNVVGSRGSVVPLYKELTSRGVEKLPVTDPQMTRFWLEIERAVEFVFRSFHRMQGGEIFVPKIPSVRIEELARSMSPSGDIEIIGKRPGEKLHEVMISDDDAHLTYEFDDYFVIRPTIEFEARSVDFSSDRNGKIGRKVKCGFSYNSLNNPNFIDVTSDVDTQENDNSCAFHKETRRLKIASNNEQNSISV